MTENEAIKILDTEKHCLDKSTKGLCKINCGDCEANIPIVYQEKAYELAIFALKEIQQYREIGTVEECRTLASIVNKVERNELAKIIDEWLGYSKIGTVEECRAYKRNGWIPVKERLPETDDYILLSFSNFSLPQIGRYEEDEEGGAFYIGDEAETCISQDLYVNAWMPLPEPYREESGGE